MGITIVGGGPVGLTIAWILGNQGHACHVIEKESSIGGCHRVRRTKEHLFTEHGPRVYIDNFVNFLSILRDMELNFYDLFTPYNFGVSGSLLEFLRIATFREIFHISIAFLRFIYDREPSKKMTVQTFLDHHDFSTEIKTYIDRICRITDGAGADRYTLYQFIQTFNQNMFYEMYQPRVANDKGLFKLWKEKLTEKGVQFSTGKEIVKIINDSNTNKISHIVTNQDEFIPIDNVIFATPLNNLASVIGESAPAIHSSFGSFRSLLDYTQKSSYEPYISITFHWNKSINLPRVWGSGLGSWSILWINLSDYIGQDHTTQSLISASVVRLDVKSPHTHKTAHDTELSDELMRETFRQINVVYGGSLPPPDHSILSPGVERHNGKWISTDHSYLKTVHSYPFPFRSPKFDNLYSVGTHNERSDYAFTSIESAVVNSIVFCHRFDKNTQTRFPLEHASTLTGVIKMTVVLLVLTILLWMYKTVAVST